LVEQLIRNQQVLGSSPSAGSRILQENIDIAKSLIVSPVPRWTDGGLPDADGGQLPNSLIFERPRLRAACPKARASTARRPLP
jgi:hypothetical protein